MNIILYNPQVIKITRGHKQASGRFWGNSAHISMDYT